jgi:hypothetical protein
VSEGVARDIKSRSCKGSARADLTMLVVYYSITKDSLTRIQQE